MLDFTQANLWTLTIVAVVLGCAIPLVAIITEQQRKARRAEMDYELKRELLAQGKSPEEIQAVLDMSSEHKPGLARKQTSH